MGGSQGLGHTGGCGDMGGGLEKMKGHLGVIVSWDDINKQWKGL